MTEKVASSEKESGKPKSPDTPREAMILETGEYSRVMKADEYREWVRQTVSGQIWARMTAIFSAIGVATIIGVISYVTTTSNTQVTTLIKGEASALKEKVDSQIKEITNTELPRIIGIELDKQVRTHELEKKITASAVEELTKDKGKGLETALQHLIINRSQEILTAREASQSSLRAVALQQVFLFGNKEQKVEAIRSVILDQKSGDDHEFELALQNYPANRPDDSIDQRKVLRRILERIARRDGSFATESWRALEQVLKQEGEIIEASAWIKNAAAPMDENYSIESLRRITEQIAKTGSSAAAGQFVTWLESNGRELKVLGQLGLASMRAPENADERRALIGQIVHAIASKGLEQTTFAEHLADTVLAIRRRDKAALRRSADSEFATQPTKKLIVELLHEPEDRVRWSFAVRRITTVRDLQEFGGYGEYERLLPAYRLVGAFLDIDPRSSDWQKVVEPKIAEARGAWTAPGETNLLVNAWVLRLQTAAPSHPSVDAVADLFLTAHVNGDPNLFLYNTQSYRSVISRSSDAVIAKVFEKTPTMIGAAERKQESDDLDKSETAILSDMILRLLPDAVRAGDRVKDIRGAFEKIMNNPAAQRSHVIWFAAVAQHAGITNMSPKSVDHYRVLMGLMDKARKGDKNAAALLSMVTNKCFLELPSVRSAVERANLHLFASDIGRAKQEAFVNEIAQTITADVRKAIGWVDDLERVATRIGTTPMRLPGDRTWISFEVPESRIPQFTIDPANEVTYTLVDSLKRVVDTQMVRVPNGSKERLIFNVRATQPGRYFLRVNLASPTTAGRAALNFQRAYGIQELLSAQKGTLRNVNAGEAIIIKTGGDDEVWVGLNAKARKTYVMRTHSLWSADDADENDGIDTVIEVYDPTESRKLKDDDDGGEEAGGERFSSLLSISSDADIVYHIKVKNISSTSGTFAFEVAERR